MKEAVISRRLGEIRSGDWLYWNGSFAQLSTEARCPACRKPNACFGDHYAYIRWFYSHQRGVDVRDDDLVAVFEKRDEAEEYREWLMTHPQS